MLHVNKSQLKDGQITKIKRCEQNQQEKLKVSASNSFNKRHHYASPSHRRALWCSSRWSLGQGSAWNAHAMWVEIGALEPGMHWDHLHWTGGSNFPSAFFEGFRCVVAWSWIKLGAFCWCHVFYEVQAATHLQKPLLRVVIPIMVKKWFQN